MTLARRSSRLVRRAFGWLDDYRYILGIQLGARLRPHPPREFARGDRVPILLLPGIYEPWHSLAGVARDLNRRGHPVLVAPGLGNNLGALRASARIVARQLRRTGTRELVVVAHSKGGLIGKALMIGPLGPRVLGMVAIATPFAGSRYARWFPDPGVRILSDRDPHVGSLGRSRGVDARIVSVYASFDPHIPGGSELAGATNVVVDTVGHFRVVDHPDVRRTVRDAVTRFEDARPDGAPPATGRPPTA
ncbi:esterase/lipase family protein [Serinibacter arcticus]|uniref:Alpha/beta hydrolase fold n=1 Tax=Serinibacter arcticus TaxID=1655435 RepID=A0A4Z1DZ75_9MICO|nr:alpha/beta hydrolase [Serinibacter arcticus]TGO04168.1 Alpha/beta hydrolase fold [Serinibacter arcticus]